MKRNDPMVMIKRRWLPLVIIALLLSSLLTGCNSTEDPLDGTKWKLTGWSISSLDPANFTITSSFADGQVSGTSAVNTYGGTYKTGPGDALAIGQLAGTLMGADEPAMRAERTFTKLLIEASKYKKTDEQLVLFDKNGQESLIFEPATQ